MDKKILDDFLRTKEDFAEQFATIFFNNLIRFLELKQKELDDDANNSYTFVQAKKASISVGIVNFKYGFLTLKAISNKAHVSYNITEEMHNALMDYSFEGESLVEVIKEVYKQNSNNETGAYVEPLMEIIAECENKPFTPIHKSLDVEFISIKKPVRKFLFIDYNGEADCRIKPAAFVKDFIDALDKLAKDPTYKFELIQYHKGSGSINAPKEKNPLYTNFKFIIPKLDFDTEPKIRYYMDKERLSDYICIEVSVKKI